MNRQHPIFNLVVLRSPDLDRAVQFYRELGLAFTRHAHGSGPEHYASEGGSVVFELYPLEDTQTATTSTRIGFSVASVDDVFMKLKALGIEVVSSPKDSPWGRRAVIRDMDGHTVELITPSPKKPNSVSG